MNKWVPVETDVYIILFEFNDSSIRKNDSERRRRVLL